MQTYIIERAGNKLTIGFKEADLSLIEPLITVLGENDNVGIARFIEVHPDLADRAVHVEVVDGDPLDAVRDAFRSIEAYFSEIIE
jgi:DNA-directed RNA polymerase subunit L